jgi:hypothetical protein
LSFENFQGLKASMSIGTLPTCWPSILVDSQGPREASRQSPDNFLLPKEAKTEKTNFSRGSLAFADSALLGSRGARQKRRKAAGETRDDSDDDTGKRKARKQESIEKQREGQRERDREHREGRQQGTRRGQNRGRGREQRRARRRKFVSGPQSLRWFADYY